LTGLLISFVGADGSGKTTLANKLMEELERKGYPTRYIWFRFPRFLAMGLLLISRLTGFTTYKSYGKYRVGTHHFDVRPFNLLYPTLALLDAIAHYVLRVWIPSKLGYIVICDRWIHDMLIDIMIYTRNPHFFHTRVANLLYRLASQANIVLLVDADDDELDARRPEASYDPDASKRRLYYRLLGNLGQVYLIKSDVDFHITWTNLRNVLEQYARIDFKTNRRLKIYADVRSPLLRPLLQNRYADLVSNWAFQGMLIRTWSERLFRFAFELISTLAIFLALSFYIPQTLALVMSVLITHTFNWSFNGNIWSLLIQRGRFVEQDGKTGSMVKNVEFLRDLERKEKTSAGSVAAIAVFGSLSRGEFCESSDIDVRVVRKSGLINCLKANVFAFYLRSAAFIRKIPLDLYVLDKVDQIKREMRSDEPPIVIRDPENLITNAYDRVIRFDSIAKCLLN